MGKGKRFLAWLVAVAMVVTSINMGWMEPAKAGTTKLESHYRNVKGTIGNTGDQSTTANTALVAGGPSNLAKSDEGTNVLAPSGGDHASRSKGGTMFGGARIGCIQFELPQDMTLEGEYIATVALHIQSVNNVSRWNNDGKTRDDNYTSVALYQTANPDSDSVSVGASGNPETFPAIDPNEDDEITNAYAYPIWSDNTITKMGGTGSDKDTLLNKDGEPTDVLNFDVTDAVKAAYAANKSNLVLRAQVPVAGVWIYNETAAEDKRPELTIDATAPTKATVKYVDGADKTKELKTSKEVDVLVGSKYAYDVEENEKVITTENGEVYVCTDESSSEITVAEDSANNVVYVSYTKAEIQSVEEPENVYVIEGNAPILPKQLTAKLDVNDMEIPVDVTWKDKELEIGENTISGTVAGFNDGVTVKVTVYECDEEFLGEDGTDRVLTADADTNYNGSSPGVYYDFGKEYKGKIITEFDLKTTYKTKAHDRAIIYYETGSRDAWGTSTARMYFQGDYFGATSGSDSSSSYASQDNIDSSLKYDVEQVYRVRMEIDSSQTPSNFKIYITDEAGVETEITQNGGNRFRYYSTGKIGGIFLGRYGFEITNHKISWQSGYATKVIEYYVNDQLVSKEEYKELPGEYTFEQELTYVAEDGTIYYMDKSNSGWDENKSTASEEETVTYQAKYVTANIVKQSEDISIDTHVGIAPALPDKVMAEYSSGIELEEEVVWDAIDAEKYASKSTFTATGKFKGTDVNVTATVEVKDLDDYLLAKYTFDDDELTDSTGNKAAAEKSGTAASTSIELVDGLSGKAVSLSGAGKNVSNIKLPDNLLADDDGNIQDDFTVSMFINRASQGDSYAMILHATETGNSKGPQGHIGLINKDGQLNVEYRTGGTTVTNTKKADLVVASNANEWTHIVLVSKGSTGETWLYLNGEEVASATGVTLKPSDLTAQNNYLGRSSWADNDYKAIFDEFAVYGTALTQSEVQAICNETLYKDQVEKTKAALEAYDFDDADLNEVTSDLALPATGEEVGAGFGTKITWKSSNFLYVSDSGQVFQPSPGEGDQTLTLTATIAAGNVAETVDFTIKVLEGDTLNFNGLKIEIAEAEAKYSPANIRGIYTEESLAVWSKAIAAANVIAAYESSQGGSGDQGSDGDSGGMAKPSVTVNYETINLARSALKTAMEQPLVLKNFDELNNTLLAAYYPLEENANDASDNGKDATAVAGVTFSEAAGAAFSGATPLEVIKLPSVLFNKTAENDFLTVSFWVKDEQGSKSNAFGFASSTSNSESGKHFIVNTNSGGNLLVNACPQGWSGDTNNISTAAPDAGTWFNVTIVWDGRTLTAYKDGQKIGSITEDYSLAEAGMDGADAFAYIGNAVYAHNGDGNLKGNVRDFRVYNGPLADEQVEEVYGYMVGRYQAKLDTAKADVINKLTDESVGAIVVEDGTYLMDVTEEGEIELPGSDDAWVTVTWDSDNTAVIKADGTVVEIPDEVAVVTLTANIIAGNQVDKVVLTCRVHDGTFQVSKTDLKALIDSVEDLAEKDYTEANWAILQERLQEATAIYKKITATQAEVDLAKNALQTAINNKKVNKDTLNDLIVEAEGKEASKGEYTAKTWELLEEALRDAKSVARNEAATQAEVDQAVEDLRSAIDGLKSVASESPEEAKESLSSSIDDVEEMMAELNESDYTAAAWQELQNALLAAKEILGDETAGTTEINNAEMRLLEAFDALPVAKEKKKLELLIESAERLKETDYTSESWANFQNELDAVKEAFEASDADENSLKTAYNKLDAAIKALVAATSRTPEDPTTTPGGDTTTTKPTPTPGGDTTTTKPTTTTTPTTTPGTSSSGDTTTTKPVTSIKFAAKKYQIAAGKKINLKSVVTVSPKDATNSALTWSIPKSSSKYASVNSKTGVVTTKKTGAGKTVTVTAAAADGSGKKATVKVQIMKNAVKKITVKKKTVTVKAGRKTTIKPTVKTTGKKVNKTLAYTSSNTKYATVNSKGVVTTKKAGAGKSVKITIKSTDGTNKSVKVTIKIKK